MSIRSSALRGLAALPVGLTLMPLYRTGKGWVRIWDFPRLQIAGLGVAALAGLARWGNHSKADRALSAALGLCLAYQGTKILPYTPLYPCEAPPTAKRDEQRRIRLLSANVLMYNRNSKAMLANIRAAGADIVCLLEPDAWWEQQMRVIEGDYPYHNKCPIENTYGMLLYSSLPMVSTTRFLVQDDIPSMRSQVTLKSGDQIMVYSIHPRPPRPNTPSYGRDAELVVVGKEVESEELPTIVMGDLNDVAWSYTTKLFQRISHMLDPRVGRGMYNTFHAQHPLLRYPLDHVFHTRDFSVARLRRLPAAGSDHFPIVVELALEPSPPAVDVPSMSEGDVQRAVEILDDANDHGMIQPSETDHPYKSSHQ